MPQRTPRNLRRSPLVIAIGTLLAAGTVQAAVITVDTTARLAIPFPGKRMTSGPMPRSPDNPGDRTENPLPTRERMIGNSPHR